MTIPSETPTVPNLAVSVRPPRTLLGWLSLIALAMGVLGMIATALLLVREHRITPPPVQAFAARPAPVPDLALVANGEDCVDATDGCAACSVEEVRYVAHIADGRLQALLIAMVSSLALLIVSLGLTRVPPGR